MNWKLFLVLCSFSAFSAIHCLNEKTVGELRKTIAPLKTQLDRALEGYRKHKYMVFKLVAQQYPLPKTLDEDPDNQTFNDNPNTEWVFYRLTLFQFLYPILSHPLRFSDALKVNALGVLLEENFTLSSPEVADLKSSIVEIIEEEKRNDFNKANLYLDELYYDLHDIKIELFPVTSGFIELTMDSLKRYCGENATNCGPEVVKIADEFKDSAVRIRELLPINTPEKVDRVAELMAEYIRLDRKLDAITAGDKIECFGMRCQHKMEQHFHVDPKPEVKSVENLLDLVGDVAPLKSKLVKAISGYNRRNQTVFARTASRYLYGKSLKERINDLPENVTIDDSSEARETFTELMIYKYLYPILSDPEELSDALKYNALLNGIIKEDNDSSAPFISAIPDLTPSLEDAIKTITKIIAEEARIGQNHTETSRLLEELYDALGQPSEMFMLTRGFVRYTTDLLADFCSTNTCSGQLIQVLSNYQVFNRASHVVHPIDDDKRFGAISSLLKSYWENRKQLNKLVEVEHIHCDVLKCYRKTEKQ